LRISATLPGRCDNEEAMNDPVLIDRKTLQARYNLSSSLVDKLVKAGLLPTPRKSGNTRTCKRWWVATEVAAAVAAWPTGEVA
jgi:hypothetical protein